MSWRTYEGLSSVESIELSRSKHKALYPPTEKIKAVEVENFPLLGRFAALRFIEWVLRNPSGVIALPTGKTPEHFIKWVRHILLHWNTEEITRLLGEYGIDASRPPDMKSLPFVQIDEFYPMDS